MLIDSKAKSSGYIDAEIDTQYLHTRFRLMQDQQTISEEPTRLAQEFRLTLTPEGYESIKPLFQNWINPTSSLASPVTFTAQIPKLILSVHDPKSSFIQARLDSTEIHLKTLQANKIDPFQLALNINTPKKGDPFQFNLRLFTKKQANLMLVEGALENFEKLTYKGSIDTLPFFWISNLIMINPVHQDMVSKFVGSPLTLQTQGSWEKGSGDSSGTFNAKAKGSWGVQIDNGVLFLTKPLEYEIPLTQDLFHAKNSFLKEIVGSDKPLKLIMDPKDFRLPLNPLNLNQWRMGKSTLELGKIHMRNQREVKRLFDLLKPIEDKEITLWFTPIYFSIKNGRIFVERLDLLVAQRYSLAAWGDIQLQPYRLDMNIGIGEQALNYAFGVNGLDENYLLKVPIHGDKDKVSIDYTKAGTRISLLVAQMQSNPHIKFLGSLLEILGGDLDPKPPKPTTVPFPWVNEPQNSKNSSKENNRKNSSSKSNLVEEIESGATSLLKQLIKK